MVAKAKMETAVNREVDRVAAVNRAAANRGAKAAGVVREAVKGSKPMRVAKVAVNAATKAGDKEVDRAVRAAVIRSKARGAVNEGPPFPVCLAD